MNQNIVLLPNLYLPPVSYFLYMISSEKVSIEAHETYPKQTFRNRCNILTSNGVLPLTIPVKKSEFPQQKVRDVRISYDTPWQRVHWNAIVSAYKSSPYFDFLADDFSPFYEKKYEFLWDFNLDLQNIVLLNLKFALKPDLSDTWIANCENNIWDCRNFFDPSNQQNHERILLDMPYYQVFNQKYLFVPNLSILDLICNEGRASDFFEKIGTNFKQILFQNSRIKNG